MKKIVMCLCILLLWASFAGAGSIKKEYPGDPVVLMKTSMGDIYIELYKDVAPETVKNFLGLAQGTREFKDPNSGNMVKRPYYDGLTFHRVIKSFMIQGGCPLGTGTGSPGYTFKDEISATALGLDSIKVFNEQMQPHPYLGVRTQQDFSRVVAMPLFMKMGIKSNEEIKMRKDEIDKRFKSLTLREAYENQGYQFDDTLASKKPLKGVLAMANSGPATNGSQFFINLIDTPWLTGKHTVFGNVIGGMDVVEKIGEIQVGEGSKPVKPVKILSIRPVNI